MALVTDMSGVCRACFTPHTTWYPAAPASVKVPRRWPGTAVPMPSSSALPPVTSAALLRSCRKALTSACAAAATGAAFGFGGVGCGGGGISTCLPSFVHTMERDTMSPSSPAAKAASTLGKKPLAFSLGLTCPRRLAKFCANIDELCAAMRPARSVYPRIVTPLSVTTTSSFFVRVQFPPPTAARSTITLPGFMSLTMYSSISTGLGLPGIAAVVITISHSFRCLWNVSFCACWNAGLLSLA
mmetsp:Transcript_132992/g.370756  ORF Transcript_132992/g.370756 Transcript_132992/m.370756 type:complete len:242 (+) Transcript_132992:977-1702(+)